MEQIELVIRLQKKLYDEILSPRRMDEEDASACYDAIKNGTPLPKGHGRLIDKDKMIRDLITVDEQYETDVDFCLSVIESYDVIVEADKEGAEE